MRPTAVESMTPFLLALPWLGLLLFVEFVARFPSELPGKAKAPQAFDRPVSVIVPARNEALTIVNCLESLTVTEYGDFEIIVVDDRSEDDTASLARSVPPGNARRILVIDGEELPAGWLGKPWACRQGADRARGELLLFTDADTTHGAALLGRSVAGLEEEGADLMTVIGRQLMETFWERLVQPQVFLAMLFRFPDFERVARNDRWRDAIANGQYLLFSRAAYETIGGHDSVHDEVVEDLALAQNVKRAGLQLRIRSADSDLATRMYRSLPHLIEGWSKNLLIGGLQSLPHAVRPVAPALGFLGGVALWLVAPAVLLVAAWSWIGAGLTFGGIDVAVGERVLGFDGGALGFSREVVLWAATVYALSVVIWVRFSRRMHVSPVYAMLYPLGAAVGSWIFLRSWIRGRTVEWKGRTYRVTSPSERP